MLFQLRGDIDYSVQYLRCVGCVAAFLCGTRGGQAAVKGDSGSLAVHVDAESENRKFTI